MEPPSPASGRREPGLPSASTSPGKSPITAAQRVSRVRRTGDVRARSDNSAVFGMHGRTLLPGRPLKPSETRDYMIDRADASEVFSDRFITRLKTLNALVRDAEEVIEGGIFYWDRDADFFDKMPDPAWRPHGAISGGRRASKGACWRSASTQAIARCSAFPPTTTSFTTASITAATYIPTLA